MSVAGIPMMLWIHHSLIGEKEPTLSSQPNRRKTMTDCTKVTRVFPVLILGHSIEKRSTCQVEQVLTEPPRKFPLHRAL